MDDPNYLTVPQVAQRFGVNPTTIYRLVQKGQLPAFKVGNQWRFSEETLDAWILNQIQLDPRFRNGDDKNSDV